MSRATVRQAVTDWLAPPAVTGLNAVFSSVPRIVPGSAFTDQLSGSSSGCVAAVHIGDQSEQRIAIGGAHSGKKLVTYTITVYLRFSSAEPMAEDAEDSFDATIDALVNRLRADRNLGTTGTPNPIFEAGEGEHAVFEITTDVTRTNKGRLLKWAEMRFNAEEIATT